MFSSRSFRVPDFKFRSLLYLESVFVQGDSFTSVFILLLVDIQLSPQRLLRMLSEAVPYDGC